MKTTSDDKRWEAVLRRDVSAERAFYFAVKTTGIYCRPSCAARHARRENVVFFTSCADAKRAGFRACKRCKPDGPAPVEDYGARVAAACRAIESAEEPPSLDELAKIAGMSRHHFHRVFKQIAGLTPKAFAQARRAERLREKLPNSATVTEAIYGSGFNSSSRFYARSSQMLGMTPKKFQQGGTGEKIRYAIRKSSLGLVLVAASEKGICAILMGDDADKLVEDMRRRFPRARLVDSGKDFERTIADVIEFVDAPRTGLNLPLDLRGTLFQRRVWEALRKIPTGSTTSYTGLAKQIGKPKAVRAVAGACAANAIAVAVPCHRVLCSDGNLSGYRWGVSRKQKLLEREKAAR